MVMFADDAISVGNELRGVIPQWAGNDYASDVFECRRTDSRSAAISLRVLRR